MIVKPRAPRFYLWRDGQVIPCYETGKKNGGVKPYSLKEARIDKALPSVTSVLSVIDKPELDNWRVSQAIHSALTLPRERESFKEWAERIYDTDIEVLLNAYNNPPHFLDQEDEFADRVLDDSEAQSAKAAEFGTRIHDAIADILNRPHMPTRLEGIVKPDIRPYLESFHAWALENIEQVHSVERCVGHPTIGVAGRLDLDCTLKGVGRCIPDFKTQAIRNNKPSFYSDWPIQLSAYRACAFRDDPARRLSTKIASIIIPSNEPGPVSVKVWDEDELDYFGIFQHALELWIYKNSYDPRQ